MHIGHNSKQESMDFSDSMPGLEHDGVAQVLLFFPRNAGWRARELAASIKYLPPVAAQKSLLQEASKDLAIVQPIIGLAGVAATAVGPVAGPAASDTGRLLEGIAKARINNVPRVAGFEWSVAKVTRWIKCEGADSEGSGAIHDGIVFNLPQTMFSDLGSRIEGSLTVSLVKAPVQTLAVQDVTPCKIRCYAVIDVGRPLRVPESGYVSLEVSPVE